MPEALPNDNAPDSQKTVLRGLWVGDDGVIHLCTSETTVSAVLKEQTAVLKPFGWFRQDVIAKPRKPTAAGSQSPSPDHHGQNMAEPPALELEELEGDAPWRYLGHFADVREYGAVCSDKKAYPASSFDSVRTLESQYLMQHRQRLFNGMLFSQLRRCQIDIETGCSKPGGFSSARRPGDRVIAIGILSSQADEPILLTIDEMTDTAERKLLEDFARVVRELDPDVIEGHNIFNFDLDYLRERCKRLKTPCAWGRFGADAQFRKSRLRVAERWIDFLRCDIPGRAVFDTYLSAQMYDVTFRELPSYGLKAVAIHFGVTPENASDAERTYIAGEFIQQAFENDREKFLKYLADDLHETRGVADFLLPTYFAQTANFPLTLQDIALRGSASKVDLLLLEAYLHARRALPDYAEVSAYEGGYTRSFATGVFKNVVHFDVASLYPSLLLHIGRNPASDSLGFFIPFLEQLREYRLKYKTLAREAEEEKLKAEYNARQASFKILINSFYGYLGFGGARFSDGELAAEVTRRGRDLLKRLISEFEKLGARPLEADTDGIYVEAGPYWENPEALLEQVGHVLPEGITLEYDGSYPAMLCYKAKNYALYDGVKITLRGSALRSRGIEPFLKELTDNLIASLLGVSPVSPLDMAEAFRSKIQSGEMPVHRLAKSEYLSQSPSRYQKAVSEGGKPRRASLEVALRLKPQPRTGDRVTYYITPRKKGQTSDWQRACAVTEYDPEQAPYDPTYYTGKIDDWIKRYSAFLPAQDEPVQTDLFD